MITQYKGWKVWGHGHRSPLRTITSRANVHLHNNWKKQHGAYPLCFGQSVASHRGEMQNSEINHRPESHPFIWTLRENTHQEMVSPVGTGRVVRAMIAR